MATDCDSGQLSTRADDDFLPTAHALGVASDMLVLSCALTEETRRVVDWGVMEALGAGGVLVNVGRGGLVDEPELVRCLREGVIGGAGLDVYEDEPDVPPELLAMDNVVLSGHRAVLTVRSSCAGWRRSSRETSRPSSPVVRCSAQ